jgi:hypothetical protein
MQAVAAAAFTAAEAAAAALAVGAAAFMAAEGGTAGDIAERCRGGRKAIVCKENAMSAFRTWACGVGLVAAAFGALLGGCTANAQNGSGGVSYGGGGGGGSGTSTSGFGGGVQLVDVDTGQTLTAQPGQGVGVFTEYQAGGHWNVWWTCDTVMTGLSCNFQISVSVSSAPVTNLASQLSESGAQPVQVSPNEVSATTTTTNATDGITFDTAPGAIVTLGAKLDGNEDGSFLFFVQDGKVNGGYQGALADPLMIEPSSP